MTTQSNTPAALDTVWDVTAGNTSWHTDTLGTAVPADQSGAGEPETALPPIGLAEPWDARGIDRPYPLVEPNLAPDMPAYAGHPAGFGDQSAQDTGQTHLAGVIGDTVGPAPWDTDTHFQHQLPASEESIVAAGIREPGDHILMAIAALADVPDHVYRTVAGHLLEALATPLAHHGTAIRGTQHLSAEQYPNAVLPSGGNPIRVLGRRWNRRTATILNTGTGNVFIGPDDTISATNGSFLLVPGASYTTETVREVWAITNAAGASLAVIQELYG